MDYGGTLGALALKPSGFCNIGVKAVGFPPQSSYMFVRMLGWAYLALCVAYAFGLSAALKGEHMIGPIWVGIVSNGGAWCLYLLFYGLTGAWSGWGLCIQVIGWRSAIATAGITIGLYQFGVRSTKPEAT